MADYIVNLTGNICETLMIIYFLKDTYEKRFRNSIFFLLCILITAFQFVSNSILLGESNFVVLVSIAYAFTLMLLFDMRMRSKYLYALFIFLVQALSETVIGMIFAIGFKTDTSFLQDNPILFAICTLMSKFFAFIIILFIKKQNYYPSLQSIKKNAFLIIALPVTSFIIMVLLLRFCLTINDTSFHIAILATSILLIFTNISVLYIIEKEKQYIETDNELNRLKNEKTHYDILAHQNQQLLIYAHDAKNHLLAIKDLNSDPVIEDYINEMMSSLASYSKTSRSGNATLDVIINRYKTQCDLKNIDFNFNTRVCNLSFMSNVDLITVLSNVMDNAFEAAKKSAERFINLDITYRNNYASIAVSNSCDSIPIMKNGNPITTKPNKAAHGLGLKSVRKTIRTYSGDINFLYCDENKIFTVTIVLGESKKKRKINNNDVALLPSVEFPKEE